MPSSFIGMVIVNMTHDHVTLQIETGDRAYPCHLESDSHV